MNNIAIEIDKLHKSFFVDGIENEVLDDFNLSIQNNQLVCVLGYTGCGKSTLLRIIAGFERFNSGNVKVYGVSHNKPTKDVLMIFQDFNQLFPWKTALGNIMFAIKSAGVCKKRGDIKQLASQLLKEVGLEEYGKYYPYQMSGGMRQRVAVARALALNPRILLMDEPFASLDEITRHKIQKMCKRIFKEKSLTVVFVTHSVDEAIKMADRIIVLNTSGGIKADLIVEQYLSDVSGFRNKIINILKTN